MSHILVISPHPDDEAIGCGGTLRRHVLSGDEVHVIFLTSGEKGGHGRAPTETIAIREQEALDAARILGTTSSEFWREPDGALAVTPELVSRLVDTIDRIRPAVVYCPHPDERHKDHQVAAALVAQALAGRGQSSHRPVVLMYEVWTPLRVMSHVEDITPFMDAKMAAIRSYKSQTNVLAFDEAFRGLARYRGEMFSWPEGEYAEVLERLQC